MSASAFLQKLEGRFSGKEFWIAFGFFLLLFSQGSLLGLSDDEAYYWVLAQKPSWGYAFHPPGVAWLIAAVQSGLGWVSGSFSEGLVRFPAALGTAFVFWVSLKWLRGLETLEPVGGGRFPSDFRRSSKAFSLILFSFWGYFALGWMMVPDIPLFAGWICLFVSTWKICYSNANSNRWSFLGVFFSSILLMLSKYSAVLALLSAAVCFLLWLSGKTRVFALLVLLAGGVIGLIPTLIWNLHHEWASVLYQIRDRHSGATISWVRYGRFWLAELVLAGPVLVVSGLRMMAGVPSRMLTLVRSKVLNTTDSVNLFCGIWAVLPAFVFLVQPLFSDFKLHWAFVIWFPSVLSLAWTGLGKNWIRCQIGFGMIMGFLVLLACHFPYGGWIFSQVSPGKMDPRWDVSNDLYGWSQLGKFIEKELPDQIGLPIVGSRYQTASQAAFYTGSKNLAGSLGSKVTFIPRSLKEQDEWPDLQISEGQGPEWPRLTHSVLFVTDNRYDSKPDFKFSECQKLKDLEMERWGFLAKRIGIWRCNPK